MREDSVVLTWAKSVFQRKAPDYFGQMQELSDDRDDVLPANAKTLELLTSAFEQASSQ